MAIRGETIGTAYVRILADGSGLSRSVEKELDKADAAAAKKGKEGSQAWQKGFADENEKNKAIEKSIRNTLAEAFGEADARKVMAESGFPDKLSKELAGNIRRSHPELRKSAEELGQRMADDIIREFVQTGDFDLNMTQRLGKALNDMKGEEDDFEKKWRAGFNSIERSTIKTFQAISKNGEHTAKTFGNIKGSLLGLARELDVNFAKAIVSLDKTDNSVKKVDKDTHAWFKTLDRVAEGMGKAFGAGARNNFVNLVGIIIGGMAKVGVALTKGLILLVDWIRGIDDATAASAKFAENQAVTASAVEETAAEVAATGPPGWIALAVAIGAVAFIAPIAVGAISALAAAVVAVASSMAFAVAGGIGIFAGLLLPMVAAIGTLVLAFKDLKKEFKGGEFHALGKQFKELRKDAAEGIAGGIKDALPDIEKALKRVNPLVTAMSGAIGDVVQNFADIANSRAFRFFINVMQQFLPSATRRLGLAFTNVFSGLLNIFGVLGRPGGPVDHVVDWIGKIADNFNKWSSSKRGRDDIKQFFDDAAASAKIWWDLLVQVWGTLRRLFFSKAGKESGDNIVSSITGAFEDLNAWLDAHPHAVRQWFHDGQHMAETIGGLLQDIIGFLDVIDTPANRKLGAAVFGTIAWHIRAASKAAEIATSTVGGYLGAMNRVKDKQWDLIHAMERLGWQMRNMDAGAIWGKITNAATTTFNWVKTKAQQAWDKLWEISTHPWSISISINWPDIPAMWQKIINAGKSPFSASGGVFVGPQQRIIGEAGPEAVVPLHRPLSQVDPSVRWLSAIAQGKTDVTTNNNGVNVGGITIVTPTKDPAAVARETINRLVAASYLN